MAPHVKTSITEPYFHRNTPNSMIQAVTVTTWATEENLNDKHAALQRPLNQDETNWHKVWWLFLCTNMTTSPRNDTKQVLGLTNTHMNMQCPPALEIHDEQEIGYSQQPGHPRKQLKILHNRLPPFSHSRPINHDICGIIKTKLKNNVHVQVKADYFPTAGTPMIKPKQSPSHTGVYNS